MPQEQFQRVKQKQIPVQRVQRKIEIPQLQLAQEAMRSKIVRMTLEQTFDERDTLNQAVARIVNETAKAWSIARFERSTHPPRSSRQWRCRRKPSDANVRRSCRVKETSRAKSFFARGKQQDCDCVEQQSSAQDPGAYSQSKQKLTRHHSSLGVTSKESLDNV